MCNENIIKDLRKQKFNSTRNCLNVPDIVGLCSRLVLYSYTVAAVKLHIDEFQWINHHLHNLLYPELWELSYAQGQHAILYYKRKESSIRTQYNQPHSELIQNAFSSLGIFCEIKSLYPTCKYFLSRNSLR